MTRQTQWDRRQFLKLMSSAPLLAAAGSRSGWAESLAAAARRARFAYVGGEHEIHVYSIASDGSFVRLQTIAGVHPAAMAIGGGNLYVANGVSEFGGLPRGSVEAYGIDRATGRLELKNRAALSLSAILPRDLAIAPGGRSVVVAVHGGGAYNVLPVLEDGRLGRVSGILKEVGCGPHASQAAAHPAALVFDRAGRLLTADQGTDTLSVLSLGHGELTVADRCGVAAGSGPSSMAIDPIGNRFYVAHSLNGSISSWGYDRTLGKIVDRPHIVRASAAGQTAALAMHPSGEVLYSSHGEGIEAWKIADNGSLEALAGIEGVQANRLYVTADGKSLFALSRDAVLRMKIDTARRRLADPVVLVTLPSPVSLALL